MRDIQVIDGADNSTYSIFAAANKEFEAMFSLATDKKRYYPTKKESEMVLGL